VFLIFISTIDNKNTDLWLKPQIGIFSVAVNFPHYIGLFSVLGIGVI
jgi:hypothetical protein